MNHFKCTFRKLQKEKKVSWHHRQVYNFTQVSDWHSRLIVLLKLILLFITYGNVQYQNYFGNLLIFEMWFRALKCNQNTRICELLLWFVCSFFKFISSERFQQIVLYTLLIPRYEGAKKEQRFGHNLKMFLLCQMWVDSDLPRSDISVKGKLVRNLKIIRL